MAWYLAFHIIGLIVWLGALLDLTRILGYHVKEDISVQKRLSWMEFRMFFFVSTPGLIVSAVFGVLIFLKGGGVATYLKGSGWFHAKLTCVLVLIGIHFWIGKKILKLRAKPQNTKPTPYKILHGIAALAVVITVILVFLKPF